MITAEAMRRLVERCDLLLDNEVFSRESLLKAYADFLANNSEGAEHNVGFVLHTGSICFEALALIHAVITCLVYSDYKADDIIATLEIGDKVLYGKDTKDIWYYKGKTTKPVNSGKQMIWLSKGKKDDVYVGRSSWKYIVPYKGNAQKMDGRGIHTNNNKIREQFYTNVLGYPPEEIPAFLNASVVLVMQPERIRLLDSKLTIRYQGNCIRLTDLVSISYYTENEEHTYRGNAAKTEPALKVTSKLSKARDLILSDEGNRHIGMIIIGNDTIKRNITELPEVMNRRSLKYVDLLMNMDSDEAFPLISDVENPHIFFCSKEYLQNRMNRSEYRNTYTDELYRQVDAVVNREIEPHFFKGFLSWSEYREFKKALYLIRNTDFISDAKEDYIINAYSLMQFFLTSVFTMSEFKQCFSEKETTMNPVERRFSVIRDTCSKMPNALTEKANWVLSVLEKALCFFDKESEKEQYIRTILSENHDKRIAIIVPKSYYEGIMRKSGLFEIVDNEDLLTISTANSFDNTAFFDMIIVVGNFIGKKFNVFKCSASRVIVPLLYEAEKSLFAYEKHLANKERAKLLSIVDPTIPTVQDECYDDLYYDNGSGKEAAEIVEIDNKVDDFIAHLNELATYRSLQSISVVSGAGQMTNAIAFGSFDSGESIYFTKFYKAYVFDGASVRESDVKNLSAGDSLVFTQNNSETRDIVDSVLHKLIRERKVDDAIIEHYKKSKRWKQVLQKYKAEKQCTIRDLAFRLRERGASVQEMTVRGWLDPDSHTVGPREENSIKQIALLVGDLEMSSNSAAYFESCSVIRRTRIAILKQIGDAIVDRLNGKQPEPGTLLFEIYERTSSIARILRLESFVNINQDVPMNYTNHPIDY